MQSAGKKKKMAEKNTLLAYMLLVYNKLLGYKCIQILETTYFSPGVCKMFNPVRDVGNMLLFNSIHCNHSLEK